MKRYTIQVRRYQYDEYGSPHSPTVVEVVKRVLHAEQTGNFNPLFCTYKNKYHLVKSDDGDLSDPFRRTAEYIKTFHIVIP